jgi:hypothetical protein
MKNEDIITEIQKLELTNNSLLLIKVDNALMSREEVSRILSTLGPIHQQYKDAGITFGVVIATSEMSWESFAPEQMAKLGWVRKDEKVS